MPKRTVDYLSPMQKLRLTLLVLALVIGIGTVGFVILEDMNPLDALYMTIITLSTVGFREVIELDEKGKVFV
ncbi:potassium channel protein, partial [candidate division GN15 bacterium]|nr:potassium channel protein [candidate division GN15 bacterium]